jgi:GPH family glycoside/pentoside/hexuronide:cation symporter
VGTASAEVMLQIYLLAFYTEAVGLAPTLAGYALALAVLWDAVTDPIMGSISDRTHSRFGRRRPYMIAGALVLALGFGCLFAPPAMATQGAKFAYLLVCYLVVNTGMTLLSVPHSALGGEMTFDRNERTEIFGWRFLFRNVGFLGGAVVPGLLYARASASNAEPLASLIARQQAGLWIAAAIVVSTLVTWWAVRRVDVSLPRERPRPGRALAELRGFFHGMASVATNKVFAPLLLAYVVAQIGRTINASLGLYFYKERLHLSEEQFSVQVLGLFIVVIVLSIGPWVWLSRRYGKKTPAFLGVIALGLLTTFTYPFLPIGQVWAPMLFASVLGGATIGSIILFESLVADIVDYDELKSGQHREGLYFGCWTMSTKICRAIGLATTGWLLEVVGYNPGAAQQAPGVDWRLALAFGPGVGVCFLIAGLIFLWMPLDRATHARVQRLLSQRWALRARRSGPAPTAADPGDPA